MLKEQKFFILKNDLIYIISQLPDDKAGQLFKHVLAYVNKQDPVSEDLVINLAFEPIKQDLIENYEKDKAIKTKRSEAGKISADLRQQKATRVNKSQHVLTRVNKSQHVLNNKTTDYQEIINIFNSVCVNLPKATLTNDRIKLIDIILKTYTLEQIGIVFKNTASSDYLNGRIAKWKANLSWLLNLTNFVKVLEGNYENIKIEAPTTAMQWNEAKQAVEKYFFE